MIPVGKVIRKIYCCYQEAAGREVVVAKQTAIWFSDDTALV